MKAALSLVLYTTQQLSVSQSDDSFAECKPCMSVVKGDIFVFLQQTLSEWISAVLGSGDIRVKKPRTEIDVNIFFFVITSSYPIQCAYDITPTFYSLKLWHGILSVDCPPPLTEEWIAINKAVFESRVTNVS